MRARKNYIKILTHVSQLLKPGGIFVLHELSRRSLWRIIPIKQFQHIEWSLHPTKSEWLGVLSESGFDSVAFKYETPYRLRRIPLIAQLPIAQFFYLPNFTFQAAVPLSR